MSLHEQFAEDLALYAVGALDADDRRKLDQHLQECEGCRGELERLRGDAALLAFGASGPRPPERSRQRLMTAIAKEPRRMRPVASRGTSWFGNLGWAVAAAAVVMVFLLWRSNKDLRNYLVSVQSNAARQQLQLEQAQQVLSTLTSTETERFTLVASKNPPQPQGKAFYVRGSGSLVFLASNMPQLPSQKSYELWLIPENGAPIPAGLFKPNPSGNATLIETNLRPGIQAKTFAITIEPETGSPAPTSQPIMVAAGTES